MSPLDQKLFTHTATNLRYDTGSYEPVSDNKSLVFHFELSPFRLSVSSRRASVSNFQRKLSQVSIHQKTELHEEDVEEEESD